MTALMTRREVATLLGVSVETVDRLRRDRALIGVTLGRSVRFRVEDVEAMLASRADLPAAPCRSRVQVPDRAAAFLRGELSVRDLLD